MGHMKITMPVKIDMSDFTLPEFEFDAKITRITPSEVVIRPTIDVCQLAETYASLYLIQPLIRQIEAKLREVCADGTVHDYLIQQAKEEHR